MFEFTEEDLKANQRGRLSPGQREWLKGVGQGGVRVQGFNVWIAVGFMFFGLCLILVLFLQNEDSRAALFSNRMNLLVFPAIVIIVTTILALSMFLARWQANKLERAMLTSASGTIRFDQDSSGESGITTYYVMVGRKKFKFADDMSRTFKEGEKYTFYYCKAGFYEFVMSYERMNT